MPVLVSKVPKKFVMIKLNGYNKLAGLNCAKLNSCHNVKLQVFLAH